MRFNKIFLALAVMMLFPAGASAATFGPDLTATSVNTNSTGISVVPVYNADGTLHAGAPFAGVLTKVRVQAGGTVASSGMVTVMRQMGAWSSNEASFQKVAQANLSVTVDAAPAGHITEIPMRDAINAGDVLGLENSDANLRAFQSLSTGPADSCAFSFSFPIVGNSTVMGTVTCNRSLPLVQGTVEPDSDGDGYGDETQDLCPSDATRQTACVSAAPPAAPANVTIAAVKSKAKTASSATRSFVIRNSGGTAAPLVPFSVRASKSVKNLKIVKGCKPDKSKRACTIPSIAPGASVTIKVSLSVKSATKTTLTAKSGSLSAKSTVKLRRKKK